MSNNNPNFPAGYVPITSASLEPGTGNPRDSAAAMGQNSNARLANLGSAVGGKKRKTNKVYRKYSGGASNDTVPAPQFQMQYTPTGGPGTSPNNQIATLTSNNMQSNSWSVDDNAATKMGGRKKYKMSRLRSRSKKGGNADLIWGCYSGGSKRITKRKHIRKSRRHRTRRASRRHRKHN